MMKLIFLDKLGCTSEYPMQAWIFSRFAPILAVVMMTLICSCNDSNKFKVSGIVEGGGDTTVLYLETSYNGLWHLVDSVVTDDGKFSFKEDAIEYPNIYRLVCGADAIYFPIDSIDQIEIKTDIKHFADNYTVSGSKNAETMMKFDKELAAFIKKGDLGSEAFKNQKELKSTGVRKRKSGKNSFSKRLSLTQKQARQSILENLWDICESFLMFYWLRRRPFPFF